ncbi:ABC transporter substrate-binding protein [Bradyrhizobium sp. Tv2a-2]|uniref:ABC transporter substrate-binding protein n=1 Tax=Bradyrhizobium sp. Tv2a-2 TaxID=113395 RepID=UPI0003FA2E55|nr:ABC transporter substrate-binding protein [Bradyrhizobium sp. Tv2a-2]
MKRREFMFGLGGLMACPTIAKAQQKERMRRIGILMPFPKSDHYSGNVQVFRQELLKLGWSESGNVQFDERWSTDNMDMVRADAASLVEQKPDVIFIVGDRVTKVFMKLTNSIPIVVGGVSDPIAVGAAESLARPGHNVTGFSLTEASMFGKMLEILKQIAPGISRVGMMYNPDNSVAATAYRRWFELSAGQLGIQPVNLTVHDAAEIEHAIASIVEQRDGGVLLPPDLTTSRYRTEIVTSTARYGVPAIYWNREFSESGGLVIYGPDSLQMYRQSAGYVNRILRGEKPADLPFQQPTTYRLTINLKTAKGLGLTVPSVLLTSADEVIE